MQVAAYNVGHMMIIVSRKLWRTKIFRFLTWVVLLGSREERTRGANEIPGLANQGAGMAPMTVQKRQ